MNNNSKKQLLTKEFIKNIEHSEYSINGIISSLTYGLFICVFLVALFVNKLDLKRDEFIFGISIFISIILAIFLYFFFFRKSIKTPYAKTDYYIVEDVLLSKFVGTIKKPAVVTVGRWCARKFLTLDAHHGNASYRGYILRFLNSGDYILPSKKYDKNYFKDCPIYDYAQREDRFYVLVDSYGVITDIFDKRLFDISLQDFELIKNKYYPKKTENDSINE